jgi:hypothetical protein
MQFIIKNSLFIVRRWVMSKQAVGPKGTGRVVDATALAVNQTLIVALVALGFVLGRAPGAWLITFVALSLATGAAKPGYGPFQLLYRRLLRPSGFVRPRPRPDDPAPHRFAQAVGASVLAIAAIALFAGASLLGWVLAWLVVALALANLLFGFCAGCFAYYHLQRLRRQFGESAA